MGTESINMFESSRISKSIKNMRIPSVRRQLDNMQRLTLSLILIGLIVFAPFTAFTDVQLTLQWDPNTEADLAGYRLYMRTENTNYDDFIVQTTEDQTQCTVDSLDENQVYYFVVRAFDTDDNESGNSNEVRYPNDASNLDGSRGAAAGGACFISSLLSF
jgi:hypothetical protein